MGAVFLECQHNNQCFISAKVISSPNMKDQCICQCPLQVLQYEQYGNPAFDFDDLNQKLISINFRFKIENVTLMWPWKP